MIAPTSGEIPSAQGLVEALKKTPANIAFIVPSIVQELSQSPALLDYCAKNLEMIMYCGGDLPQSIGDVVASKIRLVNQYGASELGLIALILPKSHRDPEDWKHVEFNPNTGASFRHVTDGIHELCIARHPKLEQQQPSFTFFPDLQEYSTRDLFVRHPGQNKENLWKWVARADDIIVFLNGEKANPISMEQHIVSHNPEIAAVLVAGAQRFQAALMIELVTDKELSPSEQAAFIERIWPTIEEANQECPAHAQIAKSHVFFTEPKKPMLRAGKGTIQRAGTLQLYADKLDSLYAAADVKSEEIKGGLSDCPVMNFDIVSQVIKETTLSVTNWQNLDVTDNFFTRGMDSFQTLLLVRKLKEALATPNIALTTIYTNPSVSALAEAILLVSKQHEVSQTSQKQAQYQARISMFKEYQDLIDRLPIKSRVAKNAHDQTVILTGSTGALGSHILHNLVANPVISHVYCLNRAADGLSLQTKRNQARGLSTRLSPNRITFLTADLSKTHLGLESETYNKLLDVATLVIHNAWPVNFNLSLSSFRPQLAGLVNLIEFTSIASTSPHMLFISSISSVLSYRNNSLQTLEEVIFDDHAPGPNGYSESKYVSERLLDHAARRLSINLSFARVGQVAGAVGYAGLWNKAEWLPSLVISSVHLGAIPDSLGPILDRIDWVPIDLLAEVLVELVLSENPEPRQIGSQDTLTQANNPPNQARVFHPLNPHPTNWETIKPIITNALFSSAGKQLESVSPDIWLSKIRQEIESTAGSAHKLQDGDLDAFLRVNPAVKLLAFFEEMLPARTGPGNVLSIERTARSSGKMQALEGVKAEWVRKWVREWMGMDGRVIPRADVGSGRNGGGSGSGTGWGWMSEWFRALESVRTGWGRKWVREWVGME